jgi:hypothetical protein
VQADGSSKLEAEHMRLKVRVLSCLSEAGVTEATDMLFVGVGLSPFHVVGRGSEINFLTQKAASCFPARPQCHEKTQFFLCSFSELDIAGLSVDPSAAGAVGRLLCRSQSLQILNMADTNLRDVSLLSLVRRLPLRSIILIGPLSNVS